MGDEEDGTLAHAAAECNVMFLALRDQGVASYVSAECLAVGTGSRWYLALESKVGPFLWDPPVPRYGSVTVRTHPRRFMCSILSLNNSSRPCDLKNYFVSFPLLLLVRFAPSTVRVSVCVHLRARFEIQEQYVRAREVVFPGLIGPQRPRPTVTRSYAAVLIIIFIFPGLDCTS